MSDDQSAFLPICVLHTDLVLTLRDGLQPYDQLYKEKVSRRDLMTDFARQILQLRYAVAGSNGSVDRPSRESCSGFAQTGPATAAWHRGMASKKRLSHNLTSGYAGSFPEAA